MRIADELWALIQGGISFTDTNIRPGMPMFYRCPEGYLPYNDTPIDQKDIEEFAELVDGQWRKRITDGGGAFDSALSFKGKYRLRCNFFYCGHENALAVVIRKLSMSVPSIEDLGLPYELKKMVQQGLTGLILVSGPTGAGKSTTIASMIEYYNQSRPASIITLEQPIEYLFIQKKSIITQREIPTNVGSFKAGIESSKRQDPDVIMVGEVRDRETTDAMLIAANSGHLVLATTHSRSAQETCESLLSYYTEGELAQKRAMLASVLLGINSQILIPSLDRKNFVLGYEFLRNEPQVANFIREGKMHMIAHYLNDSSNSGSTPMSARLARLVSEGKIKREDAIYSCHDKETISRLVGSGIR